MNKILNYIRTIPDFPRKGIMFRDITTLINNPKGMELAINTGLEKIAHLNFNKIAGIEARGFIFGSIIASKLALGFVPIRKKGKLPSKVISKDYELEYGTETIQIHQDAIKQGERILIVDDLIATGGTAEAAIDLINEGGGIVVGCLFIINLPDLKGVDKIKNNCEEVHYLCEFRGD